jgi:septal ring factor EnvC (AmiA/AmiB activator)
MAFGAAKRAHHRQQEQMRAETAARNAREAAQRQADAYADQLRRMQEQANAQFQRQLQEYQRGYQAQAEATIEAGRMQIAALEDERSQRQAATELQQRLAIQAGASQARGGAAASLKIAPGGDTASTAGTQAFKRRPRQRLAPIQSTAGINAPASSVLNV